MAVFRKQLCLVKLVRFASKVKASHGGLVSALLRNTQFSRQESRLPTRKDAMLDCWDWKSLWQKSWNVYFVDPAEVVYCVPFRAGQFRARMPLVGIGGVTEVVVGVVVGDGDGDDVVELSWGT